MSLQILKSDLKYTIQVITCYECEQKQKCK